jgi:hypothetical protein
MRTGMIVAVASLALLVTGLQTQAADADGRRGGGQGRAQFHSGGQFRSGTNFHSSSSGFHNHGHFKHHNHGHFKHHNHFKPGFGSVFIGTPFVVYSAPYGYYAPPTYYAPPAYYPPPVYYGPPAAYAPPANASVTVAPAPPMPTVIEHPHGRYELRGDGVNTPYTWVWIPNPPPPPAPPASPSPPPTSSGPARQNAIYRWTDENGVVHWTDRLSAVPPQHRAQAKQSPTS